ncbi:MAG: glycosyltransferase family 2 protein, partial [Prevotella sp.]|nr:glycosyltransferase family 2 protein [Prevotella sp.]
MKVSILVPVYGVEQAIETCTESLFAQTYEQLEYIFVDDCSPDRSIEVLQQVLSRYPHRSKQVNILRHDVNRGLGAARLTALMAATGDFVMHVD